MTKATPDDRARAVLSMMHEDGHLRDLWRAMPDGWTTVGDLRNGEGLSTLSTRLKRLREAGAVERKKEGREVFYRPRQRVRVVLEVRRDA